MAKVHANSFLHLCLRGRWDPEAHQAARVRSRRGDLDWDALFQIARVGGLIPVLYATIRGQDLVPPPLEKKLRRVYEDNAYRNTFLLTELEKALHRLATAGVPVILLKGAALAETVYDNAAVRPMIDLDVLVRRGDVPAALRGLSALGYTSTRIKPRAGAAFAFENEVVLCKPGLVDTHIEVHWSLFDSPYYQHVLSMGWFWQTALPIRMGDAAARVLGPEAQVLHLGAHLLLHHRGKRLLWLHDIAEVIVHYRSRLDWEQVLTRAQAYDLVLPLQQILPRIADEWGAPIPAHILERLRHLPVSPDEARVFNRLTTGHRRVAQRFWADLMSLPDWRQQLRFAWANLCPSPAYMQQRYDIPHSMFVPLFYLLRWCLGLCSVLQTVGPDE